MIRINLLKNKVADQTAAQPGAGGTVNIGSSSGDIRGVVVKLVLMMALTVMLMVWEGQNIRRLNDESARLQARVSELEAQSTAKAAEADGVKGVEKEARELEDKLKVLKSLSRLRLREVKTLDFMQSSIPEKVWLKTISFESDEEDLVHGHFEFAGNALATEDLSEFVKRLEDSAYLSEVIVIKNQEIPVPGKTGMVREFTFTAQVEEGRAQ